MRAAYTGNETLTFSQYADMETGKTLTAEPGGVYDIMPASGHVVPEIPEGWFVPVEPKAIEAAPAEGTAVSATADMTGETDFQAGPAAEDGPAYPENPEG